ncbi:unnamed protein product [Ectocarpus sp. CCAP 1310/34]|nr:unnamed protein product [Ectocarpus sp. CCAP 1310/34]
MDIAIQAVRAKTGRSLEGPPQSNDEFLEDVAAARGVYAGLQSEGRGLTSEEVRKLQVHGNWATNWSLVRVSEGSGPSETKSSIAAGRVRGCVFHGPVLLGDFSGEIILPVAEQYSQPCGVYNSTLSWVVVGDGALVKGCHAMTRCVVGPGAAVINCGLVSCSQQPSDSSGSSGSSGSSSSSSDGGFCSFANGIAVTVGPETRGRELACYVTMPLAAAAAAAADRSSPEAVNEHRLAVDAYAELARHGEARERMYTSLLRSIGLASVIKPHAAAVTATAIPLVSRKPCVIGLNCCIDDYRHYYPLLSPLLSRTALTALNRCGATVIGPGAVVMSCSRVVDVFIGANALLESCAVENATILSTAEEPSRVTCGSSVTSSLLQHGVTVDRGCIVSDSLLMEHSHVDNHGKLTHSVLGPDSGVGAGECLHCLVGPFVGFHHQSLLIATVWPLGRGNVGYGANVGSNHTSRQADQEIWPGEGVFFGLSTVIKFPANYSESPFSVIGSGVTCLPQRVAFPFCLINSQEEAGLPGVSPGLNHLRPGWVLSESMYMVIRSEDKRNRVDWPVFRPSMMRLMADARARLVAAGLNKTEIYVGDRGVAGLGKNYMTEASRLEGIATYTLHLRR